MQSIVTDSNNNCTSEEAGSFTRFNNNRPSTTPSPVGSKPARRRSSLDSSWLMHRNNQSMCVPERPSSTIVVTQHEQLFPEVVPPRRPLTPSPEKSLQQGQQQHSQQQHQQQRMTGMAVRPYARKSSEAVAIERIFQNFSLGADMASPLEEVAPSRSASPILLSAQAAAAAASTPSSADGGDAAFQADLANVLVWFEEELSNSQRITAAFTLLNHLTTWQLRFVLSLLSKPSEESDARIHVPMEAHADTRRVSMGPPPGFARAEVRVPSPTPMAHTTLSYGLAARAPSPAAPGLQASATMSTASLATSTATTTTTATTGDAFGDLTLEQCCPELFRRDIPAWLRSLRLHKYTGCFAGRSQAELLALGVAGGPEADAQLEALGVAALGARRKIIRVLATIAAGS